MQLRNIQIAHKLWAVVVGLVLTMVLLALGLMLYINRVDQDVARQSDQAKQRILLSVRWRGLTELAVERYVVAAMSAEATLAAQMRSLAEAGSSHISETQNAVTAMAETAAEKAQLAAVAQARSHTLAVIAQAQDARSQGDAQRATQIAQDALRPAAQTYTREQEALIAVQEQLLRDVEAQGEQQRKTAYVIAALCSAVVVAMALVLAAAMVRAITRPLDQAVRLADAIAQGDLCVEVHDERGDELGRLLRSLSLMTQQLRAVVGEVRSGVSSVSAAATQIAMGNQDLSARTEQTAANLQQTAASMEQLTSTVSQSSETARQANALAHQTAQAAERGGAVVGLVVDSMQKITDSSRRIADIIGVIDGIAFQTNILALNAAVEAARAGEQGRGFAVVAGEVRVLAGRSAEAAKEIKALITDSVGNVETGFEQVQQAGHSMQDIVHSVRQVSDLIAEMSAASLEQRDGITQVNTAVGNLDQMTQQNAALVEESSAAATAMREQARRLEQAVSVFQLDLSPSAPVMRAPALAPAGMPALPQRGLVASPQRMAGLASTARADQRAPTSAQMLQAQH